MKADKKDKKHYYETLGIRSNTKNEKTVRIEDTKEGTMKGKGGIYFENGVSIQVKSYEITRKLDMKRQKKEAKLAEGDIDKEGNVISSKEYGDSALVFVTFRLKNLSGQDQTLSASPILKNYNGKDNIGANEWVFGKGIRHEKYSAYYVVEAGADTTMTLEYHVCEFKNAPPKYIWDVDNRKLYLDFAIGAYEDVDFKHKYYSYGKFVRLQ